MKELDEIQKTAEQVQGWRKGVDAAELIRLSYELEGNPVIVEIGTYMGRGTVMLAGPRKLRGSGMVHAVDSFDCGGDTHSMPIYERMLDEAGGGSLFQHFQNNIASAGLSDWVTPHVGLEKDIAAKWHEPIDLLLLDGDQTPDAAFMAYENWIPFLKRGGLLCMGNTGKRDFAPTHDGNYLVRQEKVVPANFDDIRLVFLLTVARKR